MCFSYDKIVIFVLGKAEKTKLDVKRKDVQIKKMAEMNEKDFNNKLLQDKM